MWENQMAVCISLKLLYFLLENFCDDIGHEELLSRETACSKPPCLRGEALESHINSPKHADDVASDSGSDSDENAFCDGCERQFVRVDVMALNQHRAHSSNHHWCFQCSRDFESVSALLQHQNSLAHVGRDLKCPFCPGMFKNPAGMLAHIESNCTKINVRR
ncbi:hypothetical protein BDZ97DRAFT_2060513 [Flammula alnicola]|nr:hypothetical protein BDZ97DRAFT_2060513 [Flammula alnicola]